MGGVYDVGYHVVWYFKYRCLVLTRQIKDRREELLSAKTSEHGRDIVAVELMPDHVRLFIRTDQTAVANQFKGFGSQFLRTEFPALRSKLPPLLSRSYVVATVGAVSAETVRRSSDTQYERLWPKIQATGS